MVGVRESPNPLEVSMKRIFVLLLAGFVLSSVAAYAGGSTTINGFISDAMCGAKHLGDNPSCVKKCIKMGAAPVFVDEAKKEVWAIDNPDAVKAFYGDHVIITATADDAKKSVHIDSIADAK